MYARGTVILLLPYFVALIALLRASPFLLRSPSQFTPTDESMKSIRRAKPKIGKRQSVVRRL